VADAEFTRTETLTREETAKLLVSLADALSAGNGHARLLLGDTCVELRVPERMQTEVEVEVDGDEVELEVELKWSTAPPQAEPPADGPVRTKPAARRGRTVR
jgi:amphi-Trp domain-containing protein